VVGADLQRRVHTACHRGLLACLAGRLGYGGQFASGGTQCHAPGMAGFNGDSFLMDILYLLIPLSVVLVFFILGGLWWAIDRGQFEDIEGEGERILKDS
jgi:cbb3-type cytochrome oxidase maturation protein